jgi:hypothetical protein
MAFVPALQLDRFPRGRESSGSRVSRACSFLLNVERVLAGRACRAAPPRGLPIFVWSASSTTLSRSPVLVVRQRPVRPAEGRNGCCPVTSRSGAALGQPSRGVVREGAVRARLSAPSPCFRARCLPGRLDAVSTGAVEFLGQRRKERLPNGSRAAADSTHPPQPLPRNDSACSFLMLQSR